MTTLYDRRNALRLAAGEAAAALLDCEAEIAEHEQDPTRAEWHRLTAESLRHPSPEASARAHRAWLVHMATMLLASGRAPSPDDHCADEIAQTMDEIRASPAAAVTATNQPGAQS